MVGASERMATREKTKQAETSVSQGTVYGRVRHLPFRGPNLACPNRGNVSIPQYD